jgi:hypothetical protein
MSSNEEEVSVAVGPERGSPMSWLYVIFIFICSSSLQCSLAAFVPKLKNKQIRSSRAHMAQTGLMKLTCANDVVHPELIAKPPTNPPRWNI